MIGNQRIVSLGNNHRSEQVGRYERLAHESLHFFVQSFGAVFIAQWQVTNFNEVPLKIDMKNIFATHWAPFSVIVFLQIPQSSHGMHVEMV